MNVSEQSSASGQHILTAVAWPYANGPRHIGHVAGFGVPSDVFSRYQRLAGNNVLMVSGTDEHGTPIVVQAVGRRVDLSFGRPDVKQAEHLVVIGLKGFDGDAVRRALAG